jgi:ABC-type Mn2+/Zn2+ transport system permease subunit
MAGAARRFWLTVVPLLVGFSAVGLLVFAALFPNQLFPVESEAYIATAAAALVSLGLLVWQLATPNGSASESLDRPGR